ETAADFLTPIAADVQRAPIELLDESQGRVQARGGEIRVDGVGLNHAGVARVIDVRVEAGPRREALLMLPAETDRAARRVELSIPLERKAPVDEAVQPAVPGLRPVREVPARVPVARCQKGQVVVDDDGGAEGGRIPVVLADGG